MFLRPIARSRWRLSRPLIRHISSYPIRHKPAPFPTIPSCPSPTCSCAETPAMPEGLGIDHSKPLNGTMAAYAEQVLICTGKEDWMSRIEEENSGDNLAADLKELMGRGGVYSDVLRPSIAYSRVLLMIYSHTITLPLRTPLSQAPCRKDLKFKRHLHTSSPPSNTSPFSHAYPSIPSRPLSKATSSPQSSIPHTRIYRLSIKIVCGGARSNSNFYMVYRM
jgi:hypothetical protein